MNKLYKPTKLKTLELKNHFFVPPMVTYAADDKGKMNYEQIDHYVAFAQGGFGMITMESQALKPNEIEAGWSLLTKENEDGYKDVIKRVKNYGAKIGAQINNSTNSVPANYKEMTMWDYAKSLPEDYLEQSVKHFVELAKRVESLNFDYVEIHFAHNYLFDCLFTTRDSEATYEERSKYLIKVMEAVFEAVSIPVGIRISTWWEGKKGELIDLTDDYVKLLTPYKEQIEYVSVTTSGYRKGKLYNFKPAIDFKNKFKGVPIITTSGIANIEDAVKLSEDIDLVGIGSAAFKNKNVLYEIAPSIEEASTLSDKYTVLGRMILGK